MIMKSFVGGCGDRMPVREVEGLLKKELRFQAKDVNFGPDKPSPFCEAVSCMRYLSHHAHPKNLRRTLSRSELVSRGCLSVGEASWRGQISCSSSFASSDSTCASPRSNIVR